MCAHSVATSVVALERRLAGQALVQHAAERVDVGARVDRLAADLLGRDVVERARRAGRSPVRPALDDVAS